MSTEISDAEVEAMWAVRRAELCEQENAARAELEAWDHLPKAERNRQSLEAFAAKYPHHVRLEWLPDRRVNVSVLTVTIL